MLLMTLLLDEDSRVSGPTGCLLSYFSMTAMTGHRKTELHERQRKKYTVKDMLSKNEVETHQGESQA